MATANSRSGGRIDTEVIRPRQPPRDADAAPAADHPVVRRPARDGQVEAVVFENDRAPGVGGVGRDEAYAIVQRAALRAADERAPLRELLAVDPVVAQKLPLAELDACFDEATFLRNVHEVIGRLDALDRSATSKAAKETTRADG